MKMREPVEYQRGDIVWINCDPSIGVEPTKVRTCVVVSNDLANRYGQAVTVVPTQRFSVQRAARGYMVDLRRPRSNMKEKRVANASMVMTYDQGRVVGRAGRISKKTSKALDQALGMHLGLAEPTSLFETTPG